MAAEPDRHSGSGESADRLTVRALARGLSILSLFDVDNRHWTIDDMAEQTGLLRMTAYRMVRTLEAEGYLARDDFGNRYHLGPATLAMAYVKQGQAEFVQIARPFLEDLQEATSESVTLAVEVDGAPVCVDIINSARPFRRRTAPGRVIGDVASVQGKVFAAFKPAEERKAIAAGRHHQLTPLTETNPDGILHELERVAREDIAYDLEGLYPGCCAVGAPVRDQAGEVVACLSVVMPSGRFGPEEQELCVESVRQAATSLSAFLGWNPSTPTLETSTSHSLTDRTS
jgi:IclR family transcriptional regulator, pca regulon regulatory protein